VNRQLRLNLLRAAVVATAWFCAAAPDIRPQDPRDSRRIGEHAPSPKAAAGDARVVRLDDVYKDEPWLDPDKLQDRAQLDAAASEYTTKAAAVSPSGLRTLLEREGRPRKDVEAQLAAFDVSRGVLNVVLKPGAIVLRFSATFMTRVGMWVYLPGASPNAETLALPESNPAAFLTFLRTLKPTPAVLGYCAPANGRAGGAMQARLLLPPSQVLKAMRTLRVSMEGSELNSIASDEKTMPSHDEVTIVLRKTNIFDFDTYSVLRSRGMHIRHDTLTFVFRFVAPSKLDNGTRRPVSL